MRDQLRSGMIVRVHQKIKDINRKGEERERIQIFEGIVLAVKHGKEAGATFTVRKVSDGIGVEKIFPIHSPVVDTVELVRDMDVSPAKAYYLRGYKKKLKERKQTISDAAKSASVEDLIGKAQEEPEPTAEPQEEAPVEATA